MVGHLVQNLTRVKVIWQNATSTGVVEGQRFFLNEMRYINPRFTYLLTYYRSAHNVVCKRNLVDIFYHIRQVAARIAKLVLVCAFGTRILRKGRRRGSAIAPFEKAMLVS